MDLNGWVSAFKKFLPRKLKERLVRLYWRLRSDWFDRELLQFKQGIKLNLGPGYGWKKAGWLTVDFYQKASVQLDLRKLEQFPLETDSTTLIYASHVLEHMTDAEGLRVLSESYRILKPGGLIRLSVPDFEKARNAYFAGDAGFFKYGGSFLPR